jgi:hypothetical protein
VGWPGLREAVIAAALVEAREQGRAEGKALRDAVTEVVRDMDDGEGFAAPCCHQSAARLRAVLDQHGGQR